MFFSDTQLFVFGLMAQNIGCFATPDVLGFYGKQDKTVQHYSVKSS